jgi:hypothetical protein
MAINSIGLKNQYAGPYNRGGAKSGPAFKNASQKTQNTAESQAGSLRKFDSQERLKEKQARSVVDQSMTYAQQLKASRTKSEKASLEKKKLQYSFKKISSQIIRSKNSVSARKAVQSAKREIMRLKRLKANGEYDEEELQLAIDHAKSMEKVAKKKVAHLEQEEMVERNGKGVSAVMEEIEEKKEESSEDDSNEEEIPEELLSEEDMSEELDKAAQEYDYEMELQAAQMREAMSLNMEQIAESSSDSMEEMMSELSEGMMDMMEELDLTELMESTLAPDPNMSEDDLKMLKIKHRTKEMQEIAEADKEYLKGIMEHEKSKAAAGITGMGASSPGPSFGSDSPKITPMISMPGAAAGAQMSAPTLSGGFDVSV